MIRTVATLVAIAIATSSCTEGDHSARPGGLRNDDRASFDSSYSLRDKNRRIASALGIDRWGTAREYDELTKSWNVKIGVAAEDRGEPASSASLLFVNCTKGRLSAGVLFNRILGYEEHAPVAIRANTGRTDARAWVLAQSGRAVLWPGDAFELLRFLQKIDTVVVQANPLDAPTTAVFATKGLEYVIAEVHAVCPDREALATSEAEAEAEDPSLLTDSAASSKLRAELLRAKPYRWSEDLALVQIVSLGVRGIYLAYATIQCADTACMIPDSASAERLDTFIVNRRTGETVWDSPSGPRTFNEFVRARREP